MQRTKLGDEIVYRRCFDPVYCDYIVEEAAPMPSYPKTQNGTIIRPFGKKITLSIEGRKEKEKPSILFIGMLKMIRRRCPVIDCN